MFHVREKKLNWYRNGKMPCGRIATLDWINWEGKINMHAPVSVIVLYYQNIFACRTLSEMDVLLFAALSPYALKYANNNAHAICTTLHFFKLICSKHISEEKITSKMNSCVTFNSICILDHSPTRPFKFHVANFVAFVSNRMDFFWVKPNELRNFHSIDVQRLWIGLWLFRNNFQCSFKHLKHCGQKSLVRIHKVKYTYKGIAWQTFGLGSCII